MVLVICVEGYDLKQMADIYLVHGDLDEATNLLHQSIDIFDELSDLQSKSDSLLTLAIILQQRGHQEQQAINLLQEALKIRRNWVICMVKRRRSVYWELPYGQSGAHGKAIVYLSSGLMSLVQMKIEPHVQKEMASILVNWRQKIGRRKI